MKEKVISGIASAKNKRRQRRHHIMIYDTAVYVCMWYYTVYVVYRLPRLGLTVVCVLFLYQQPEFSYKSMAEGRRVVIIAYFQSDKKFP